MHEREHVSSQVYHCTKIQLNLLSFCVTRSFIYWQSGSSFCSSEGLIILCAVHVPIFLGGLSSIDFGEDRWLVVELFVVLFR